MLPAQGEVDYLSGSPGRFQRHTLPPYSGLVSDFLADLSRQLLQEAATQSLPDVVAFAFFCRRANISRLGSQFSESGLRLGRGIVFHIAPGNVPVTFAYSYLFGLLAGNSNIVRVPSKRFPQVDAIVGAIERVLMAEKYAPIRSSSVFARYPATAAATAAFSAICNARVIWGGDETVRAVRALPIPPRSIDVTFADRYSFCAMDAQAVGRASKDDFARLVSGFYNDTYLMDQNACSSPHLVVWLGDNADTGAASERFWQALYAKAAESYSLEPVAAVDKFTALCQDAISLALLAEARRYDNLLYVVTLSSLPGTADDLRGKWGYFYEYQAETLDQLAPLASEKCQTLTYYGISETALRDLIATHRPRGIDRIVPVGTAMDISPTWDGIDLIRTLSRIVDVR